MRRSKPRVVSLWSRVLGELPAHVSRKIDEGVLHALGKYKTCEADDMHFPIAEEMESSTVAALLRDIPLPDMAPATQLYDRNCIENVEAEVVRLLRHNGCLGRLYKGQTVAITAGSRGIANLSLILRTVVREVKAFGGVPFLVPAMGSHGGASAAGQIKLLKGLGIDEDTVEAPICSSMETVIVGTTLDGLPVHMDLNATKADAVIAVNRVKPHTSYRGAIESGVVKMLAIGLGKQKGAETCHGRGYADMAKNVAAFGKVILGRINILCGIAILENAFHETASIHVLDAGNMIEREISLLQEAWRLFPKIFFDELDILVIDEIGKDISGTGFDCNIVGRYHNPHAYGGPAINRLAILDITDKSKGNGNGIGMADAISMRAYDKFSPEQCYPNALTATATLSVKLPMILANDRMAIQACVKVCGVPNPEDIKLVRIKNTIEMERIFISRALTAHCREHPNLELVGEFQPLAFNNNGNLW